MSLFFLVSKLLWFVAQPSHVLIWMAIATASLCAMRRFGAARAVGVATAVTFLLIGVLPTSSGFVRSLEGRYPRPALPPHIDGVITLGGGLGAKILESRDALSATNSESRVIETFALARRYPDARIVFSGGWGRYADAVAAREIFHMMGLDLRRLTLESQSHNTFENLLYSQRLVRPQPGETWVLATSAFQMPRAMAVAKQLGWRLIPWPTDYLTTAKPDLSDSFDIGRNLMLTDLGVKEWLGLLAYHLGHMANE